MRKEKLEDRSESVNGHVSLHTCTVFECVYLKDGRKKAGQLPRLFSIPFIFSSLFFLLKIFSLQLFLHRILIRRPSYLTPFRENTIIESQRINYA